MIIFDTMGPILSHADGQTYDSKSAYLAGVKASGCEVVGNDTSVINDRPTYQANDAAIERDIAQTMKQKGLML